MPQGLGVSVEEGRRKSGTHKLHCCLHYLARLHWSVPGPPTVLLTLSARALPQSYPNAFLSVAQRKNQPSSLEGSARLGCSKLHLLTSPGPHSHVLHPSPLLKSLEPRCREHEGGELVPGLTRGQRG